MKKPDCAPLDFLFCFALFVFAALASAQTDASRLLTGLTAEVTPDGVALAWAESGKSPFLRFCCALLPENHHQYRLLLEHRLAPVDSTGSSVSDMGVSKKFQFQLNFAKKVF